MGKNDDTSDHYEKTLIRFFKRRPKAKRLGLCFSGRELIFSMFIALGLMSSLSFSLFHSFFLSLTHTCTCMHTYIEPLKLFLRESLAFLSF